MTSSKAQRVVAMVDAMPWRCGTTFGYVARAQSPLIAHGSVAASEIRSARSATRAAIVSRHKKQGARESFQCHVARSEHGS
jgi:hypothetical protein